MFLLASIKRLFSVPSCCVLPEDLISGLAMQGKPVALSRGATVFEDRGGIDMRRIRRLKRLSLGMPRKASHLSSSTIIGMSRFLFCSHDLCNFLERLLCLLFPFLL